MLPYNPGGHTAYQNTFVSEFLKLYPDLFSLSRESWDYIVQFGYLDLSLTDTIMQECYSIFGPEPRLPSCMLRSYLLALKLKVTSITQWCRMLKESPWYSILSGFTVGDPPGVGTFYDFFTRVWKSDSEPFSASMEEPFISFRMTIQDCLTYRQETVKNGKRNTTEELPWNVPTNARKETIN